MPTPPKLTGKRRHRTLLRYFRKPLLVLQLEVEGIVTEHNGGYVKAETQTWWIDAEPIHLTIEDTKVPGGSG